LQWLTVVSTIRLQPERMVVNRVNPSFGRTGWMKTTSVKAAHHWEVRVGGADTRPPDLRQSVRLCVSHARLSRPVTIGAGAEGRLDQ